MTTATAISTGHPLGARNNWPLPHCLMTTLVGDRGDDALLVAYLRGDDRAFDTLEAHLRTPLHRLASRWTRGLAPDLHGEVVQEVWLAVSAARIMAGATKYDPESAPALKFVASFLPNAAQRVCAAYRPPLARSRARRKKHRPSSIVPRSAWEPTTNAREVDDVPSPDSSDDAIAMADARIDLDRVVSNAEPDVARAIVLVRTTGATLSEAAKAVGLSATTFSRRLSALGRLAA